VGLNNAGKKTGEPIILEAGIYVSKLQNKSKGNNAE
jgi:hypothetical protein